jgi:carbon starvation protein
MARCVSNRSSRACTLDPGVYLSMNVKVPGATEAAVAQNTAKKVTDAGFPVSVETMNALAQDLGETTLFGRTGGAATLAVGMAQIFARVVNGRWLDLWYHFAIMFEALFILTTLDAGTRVGRYLLQDVLGHIWKPLADTKNLLANTFASLLVVGGWGFFLIQGVRDPDGGVKALWPIFGIANQLLASLALCLATTVILKMHLGGATATLDPKATGAATPGPRLRPVYALVTLLPLIWLLSVTVTAGLQKIFHEETRPQFPRIGFLQIARELKEKQPALAQAVTQARDRGDASAVAAAEKALRNNRTLHFNNWVDVWVTGAFLVLVLLTVSLSVREWILLLARRRLATIRESEPVWLPEYAIAEARPLHLFSLFALCLALIKELSGQAYIERSEAAARDALECLVHAPPPNGAGCAHDPHHARAHPQQAHAQEERLEKTGSGQRYAAALDQRYRGVTRCC